MMNNVHIKPLSSQIAMFHLVAVTISTRVGEGSNTSMSLQFVGPHTTSSHAQCSRDAAGRDVGSYDDMSPILNISSNCLDCHNHTHGLR